MKKIFRKNQFIVTVLALLIVAAGYLNYTDSNFGIGKDKEAANNLYETTYGNDDLLTEEGDIASLDIDTENSESVTNQKKTTKQNETESETVSTEPGEAVLTSNGKVSSFVLQARLDREQTRSKNKESLLEIINNKELAENEKKSAIESMVSITKRTEMENTLETLLLAKGFSNIVVTLSDEQVDVILAKDEVSDSERAQIEDTIKRKTGLSADCIVITPATGN